MRTLEASGKTIDEAIFNGLKELEVSIDEVEIDIVQHETKGLLGIGAKPAIVRLIEREPEQIVIPDYLTDADRVRTGSRSGQRESSPYNRDRRSSQNRRERAPRQDRRPRPERRDNSEAYIDNNGIEAAAVQPQRNEDKPRRERVRRDSAMEKPQIDYTLEAAENNEAAAFLKQMLSLMGVEAQVLANVSEEEGIRLRIDSSGMGVLIGHRGETLDAIQYRTSLHVNRARKERGYTRVTIDTEGYRERREETLARLARKVASQVRSTGRARTLEPMNPYERRVLHATLQNNPYVTTYSEGEEPNRRVVIAPKSREER